MRMVFLRIGVLMGGEGGDEADDGDEQTESVAGGLAKCSGSSQMEMTVGEMQ